MAPILAPDLSAPWDSDTVLQLRTSKMKTMRNLAITTGIYKQPRNSRVFCSFTGLSDDEHDLTFHGGIDKAVHQYYPGHYPSWQAEYPGNDDFQVGGFGENIVSERMNERNVCIGDVIRVGGALLQVSLPRQPCFKLNHRFGIKNFAGQTWKKSRTGWYYRVLEEGLMGVGDKIDLVERKWPEWTIERVQEYLHRDTKNLAMLMELEQIPEFGAECHNAFIQRIASLRAAQAAKDNPKEPEKFEKFEKFTLLTKTRQTPRITSFTFSKPGSGSEIDPGCFVRLRLPNGLLRSYSLVSGDTHGFTLGVALDKNSRGGSRFLHEELKEGDELLVGKITEGVPTVGQASNHIFIAGGIGITAFLAHVDVYRQINLNYTLHYAVRSVAETPFKEEIEKMGGNVVVYDGSKGERMDVGAILRERMWNSFVYTCGPQKLVEEVQKVAGELGMGRDEIHYEAFQFDGSGDPFEVEVPGGKVLQVLGEKTLLETVREVGLELDSSCEVGNCGACRVTVKEGKVEHRGSALSDEEKAEGAMLSCVSRGVGRLLIDW